ncbi:orf149.CDS.1, partial (mitochondrion) [Saccharomyces cerevisiae]
MIKWTM